MMLNEAWRFNFVSMVTVHNIVLNVNTTLDTNLVSWYSIYIIFRWRVSFDAQYIINYVINILVRSGHKHVRSNSTVYLVLCFTYCRTQRPYVCPYVEIITLRDNLIFNTPIVLKFVLNVAYGVVHV